MARIQTIRDLRVWQSAMDLAMEVFLASKAFPTEERFSLTDQIRRSSRSIAANIAEAWRKRRYEAAFIAKLSDAEAEAGETQTWTELALRCGYLSPEQAESLDRHCDELLSQLVHMISHAEDWTLPNPRS